jgi:hypothetical protein
MHRDGPLPHLHEDLEDVFPKAIACEDAGDLDPTGEDGLEERGAALGRAPEKKKEAVGVGGSSGPANGSPR